MSCLPCARNSQDGLESSCCSSTKAWSLTAVAGAVILALGIVFVVSVTTSHLGSLRNLMLKAAKTMDTTPIVLPVLVSALGGTVLIAAILGYASDSCSKSNHSRTNLDESDLVG